MKGQISTELLIIVGLVLILFIPILITIYIKASETNERLSSYQSTVAQARLVNSINSIGHLGSDAYIIAEVYLPPGVNSVRFLSAQGHAGGEVVVNIISGDRSSELADVVKFPLTYSGDPIENPSPGIYRFNISNAGNAQVKVQRMS